MTPAGKIAVIVNGDDFGQSPWVNQGIATAFEEGILTSASLMATGPAFDQAVDLAKGNPGLGVGVHLDLLRAKPVTGPEAVPDLVDGRGRLPGGPGLLVGRLLTRRGILAQVGHELRSQIEKVMAAGLEPTHVDSHLHVHSLPGVLDAALEAASACGIRRVRLPLERSGWGRMSWITRGKCALIAGLSRWGRASVARRGFAMPDHFVGFSLTDAPGAATLADVIARVPPGVTEIMCHPGGPGSPPGWPHREAELAALLSPTARDAIERSGAALIHFGDLPTQD